MTIQGILGLKTLAQAGCPAVVEEAVGRVLTEVTLPVTTRARTGGKAAPPLRERLLQVCGAAAQ